MPNGERATAGSMTIAEYTALPREDARHHELSRGRLVSEPRPGRLHGAAVALLAHHLVAYALEHGGVVTTETGFVLAENPPTLRGPDVAYVRTQRPSYGASEAYVRGAPDLAIEVASPSNSAGELQAKVLEYFEAGTRQVWVVHPRTRTVVVHTSASEARTLGLADEIDGGDLLPGLTLAVREIFRF